MIANERIHRFLIQHSLARLGYAPPGIVFPVSAVMSRDRARDDMALRATVLNETKGLYQYFYAAPQMEYFPECVAEKIQKDLIEEIGCIEKYDRALHEEKEIVDLSGGRASLLVPLIMQNKGRLEKNKRDIFSKITGEELAWIEKGIASVVP